MYLYFPDTPRIAHQQLPFECFSFHFYSVILPN